jgi:hypothetical protein
MANPNIPLMSQRQGTPLTSVGSGSAILQNPTFASNRGSGIDGALIGALAGAMTADKIGGTGGGTSSGTGVRPGVAPGGVSGGAGSGAGSSGSYVSPTNNPSSGKTSGGAGTYIGGGGTGTAGSIVYPPNTTQQQINADAGMTNGQPNVVITGVDPGTGKVIAQPNYNIGGSNLTGVGAPYQGNYGSATQTATPPSEQTPGTYFQDSYGNIYDGSGNLYAVNSGGSYYVKSGQDNWISADSGEYVTSNDLFNYTRGGYDPSTANDYYDTEEYFANPDNSIRDYYDTADYFDSGSDLDYLNWLDSNYKNGGMATPLMANGGKVPNFAEAGPVTTNATKNVTDTSPGVLESIQNLLSGTNVKGALLGTLISQLMSGNSTRNTYKGLDMSKQGVIAPHTTNFGMGPANYVPYTNYMPEIGSPLRSGFDNTKLLSNLGASGYTPNIKQMGMAEGGRIPTHYTFGTQVNAEDFLAEGGMPHNTNVPMTGGLSSNSNVPMFEGRKDYRNGSYVTGEGDGQSDDIPAMLADGEYVIDADVVAALGNGSNKAGAEILDKFRANIRDHKRSAHNGKIPPKAKSPLAYLKGAK